ncbi:hypothetical protein A33K_18156 [Burkholderia humptydooensis MSMB43]|nr:hypothetical protein A33K_18156 [Burkholderia humptydooensis MSMB43]
MRPRSAITIAWWSRAQAGGAGLEIRRRVTIYPPINFDHRQSDQEEITMRLLLALLLPWLQFFTIGRPFAGIICLILQITLIGWLPAAIWSVYALSQYKTDKKIEEALGRRS